MNNKTAERIEAKASFFKQYTDPLTGANLKDDVFIVIHYSPGNQTLEVKPINTDLKGCEPLVDEVSRQINDDLMAANLEDIKGVLNA